MREPLLKLSGVKKRFGNIEALRGVDFTLGHSEVHCLLGDNGAGKSTLIKVLSGAHDISEGQYQYRGKEVVFKSTKEAMDSGIACVYQHLSLIPLLSAPRNFFLGREPHKKWLQCVSYLDEEHMEKETDHSMREMGIALKSLSSPIVHFSGGEKQCLAIAKAIYFGARVLILDEPTAALGVKQSEVVLKMIEGTRDKGVSVVYITHNVHHALQVANRFTILCRGKSLGTYLPEEVCREDLLELMAGIEPERLKVPMNKNHQPHKESHASLQ